jgi:histidinol-phosphate phosphatase family protein
MSRWSPAPAPAHEAAAAPPPSRPVLFLDRDGVLLIEKDYLSDPAAVELEHGVPAALRDARAAGFLLICVSNQSGLGRGRFTAADFEAVMARFADLLQGAGCPLDAYYYCPHAPGAGCLCRKPAPGLLAEAAAHFRWDPARAWMIGDKISDVDFALGAGLRPVLVLTGYGHEQARRLGDRRGVAVAADLAAAVRLILAEVRA